MTATYLPFHPLLLARTATQTRSSTWATETFRIWGGPETLKRTDDYRVRDQWMFRVQFVFEGSPRKFGNQSARVLYAFDKIKVGLARDFVTHANSLSAENEKVPRASWGVFTHWFENVASDKTEVRFAATRDLYNTYQAADQSPRAFAGELASIERLMSPLPATSRADIFRCRLVHWLEVEPSLVENVDLLSRDALMNKAEATWQSRKSDS